MITHSTVHDDTMAELRDLARSLGVFVHPAHDSPNEKEPTLRDLRQRLIEFGDDPIMDQPIYCCSMHGNLYVAHGMGTVAWIGLSSALVTANH